MLTFTYKNHRGEVEVRSVEPIALEYIPAPPLEYEPGWFLRCKDFSRGREGDIRSFALKNIQGDRSGVTIGLPTISLPLV